MLSAAPDPPQNVESTEEALEAPTADTNTPKVDGRSARRRKVNALPFWIVLFLFGAFAFWQ